MGDEVIAQTSTAKPATADRAPSFWDRAEAIFDWGGRATDGIGDVGFGRLQNVTVEGSRLGDIADTGNEALGPAGVLCDVASAGFGAADTISAFREGRTEDAWNGVGKTTNGVMGAAMGLGGGPIGSGIWGLYGLAADGLGSLAGRLDEDAGFDADSVTGEAVRGMWGDKSIGGVVADELGGGIPGWVAGSEANVMANTNPLTLTLQAGDIAAGGLVNFFGNWGDENKTKDDYWGDFKGSIANGIGSLLEP
jgi:hypothetical protein